MRCTFTGVIEKKPWGHMPYLEVWLNTPKPLFPLLINMMRERNHNYGVVEFQVGDLKPVKLEGPIKVECQIVWTINSSLEEKGYNHHYQSLIIDGVDVVPLFRKAAGQRAFLRTHTWFIANKESTAAG